MKSIVLLALLGFNQAVRLRDDDLFSDDGQVSDTLASLQSSEKAHGAKFAGLSAED